MVISESAASSKDGLVCVKTAMLPVQQVLEQRLISDEVTILPTLCASYTATTPPSKGAFGGQGHFLQRWFSG